MMINILSEHKINEEVYPDKELESLIRILSRTNTIPKLPSINIFSSNDKPNDFFIVPSKSIVLGDNILKNPSVALIYLRIGMEWQIWYNAFHRDHSFIQLIDLAAITATKYFFWLLPIKERKSLMNYKGEFIQQLISKTFSNKCTLENIKIDLIKIHGISKDKKRDIDSKHANVIKFLGRPTENLIASGGDLRLDLSRSLLLNKYGCTPFPRPEAYTFASSTATSISIYAYENVEKERIKLISESLETSFITASINFSLKLKSRLYRILGLEVGCEVIFSPSGTDSALQISAITQTMTKKPIAHILVGSDETGSGVSMALRGCNFENITALKKNVNKGALIEGFRKVDVMEVPFRNLKGLLKKSVEIDNEVVGLAKGSIQKGYFVVLHMMNQSKLGFRSPSENIIESLNEKEQQSLQIVVDASQLRMDREILNLYLKNEFIVTITGSKYFTGPPYSGALLIPKNLNKQLMVISNNLPIGLSSYYNYSEWPNTWEIPKSYPIGVNLGILIRWSAAIYEMKRFFSTPIIYRNIGIRMFCDYVKKVIQESLFLESIIIFDTEFSPSNGLKSTNNRRTIFPFFILKNGKVLPEEEVVKIYQLLNQNIESHFLNQSMEIIKIVSKKCHIGQAVKVIHNSGQKSAVLRISLGSRVISNSWKDKNASLFFKNVDQQMNQVTIIVRKMELIINHPNLLDNYKIKMK